MLVCKAKDKRIGTMYKIDNGKIVFNLKEVFLESISRVISDFQDHEYV
jgi:hypothetical protein